MTGATIRTTYEASGTVPEGSTRIRRDRKRCLWLIGFVVPSLAFVAFVSYVVTGWGAWFWLGPIAILIMVPAIDLLTGLDRSNPPDDVIEALENDKYYRWHQPAHELGHKKESVERWLSKVALAQSTRPVPVSAKTSTNSGCSLSGAR